MKAITFRADDLTVRLMAELAKLNPPLYKNRSQCLRLAVQSLIVTARQATDWKSAAKLPTRQRRTEDEYMICSGLEPASDQVSVKDEDLKDLCDQVIAVNDETGDIPFRVVKIAEQHLSTLRRRPGKDKI